MLFNFSLLFVLWVFLFGYGVCAIVNNIPAIPQAPRLVGVLLGIFIAVVAVNTFVQSLIK